MRRNQITPEMLAMMDPKAAAQYGYGFADKMLPRKPSGEPTVPKLEREEHAIFESWLHLHGFAYRHSRTDKPTRETCGAPDFSVYEKTVGFHDPSSAKCLAIEFKLPGNKLSKAQENWAAKYGGTVHVLATAAEAILLVVREFGS